MFLIMSAAYVGQELQSEFGKLPPSFLPLGNKRLFLHQAKLAPAGSKVYLAIPESYNPSSTDIRLLESEGIKTILTPDGLTLGEAIVASLNLSGHSLDSSLHILFGDTLFTEVPKGEDIICVSDSSESYNWAMVTNDDEKWLKNYENIIEVAPSNIVNGYFNFTNPRLLIQSITKEKWDFLEGISRYNKNVPLKKIHTDKWLDFGHVNTYYRSKARYTTQRAFNDLKITTHWVEKSSFKVEKILAEALWFEKIPYDLKQYTPQYLGRKECDGRISYKLEYLYHTALNELYVFSELPVPIWKKILNGTIHFLNACQNNKATKDSSANKLNELFGEKTYQRLKVYCAENGFSLCESWFFNGGTATSLEDILRLSELNLPNFQNEKYKSPSILHGDFCFSNILYDFKTNRIKTIDPRGLTIDEEKTIYGDIRYDIAKLSHSIIGMYDFIIAGYYDVEINGRNISFSIDEPIQHRAVQEYFTELANDHFNISSTNLLAMQIQLFLSMLPLHADDKKRQDALFANAFRLFEIMKRTM
ncbi:capsular biosynthesis protein [Vibrio alginolyticus]